jgi:tetratricopeptide (TPR) repeat protein
VPQSREADIDQLLEARHHHHAAGDVEEAVEVTGEVCSQLDTWGAYGRVEQLCREVLEWVPERSRHAAVFLHRLGLLAQQRGSYEEALDWYRQSLAILEELGNRAGLAYSYGQLGNVSYARGSYEEALEWYRKCLAISEELGDRASMANAFHQLGVVAEERGSYEEALDWYRKALAIDEELGDRAGMASSLSQIGVLLTETGRPEEAVRWNLRSLAIRLEIGVPQVRIDLHWLGRQREGLGEERFGEILREHLDEEGAGKVLRMLEEFEGQE